MARSVLRGAAALLLVAASVLPADAQSLTSTRGLGYPLLPTDARSDALGGLGLGLQGLSASLVNPASAAGVLRRGATVTVSSVDQTGSLGDASDRYGATRFPLIQLLYPAAGVVFTAGYGGYLDQSWAVARDGEELVGGDSLTFQDFIRSNGGIGQVQLGIAVPLGRLALGGALGAHTGSQRLLFQRRFGASEVGNLDAFSDRRVIRYSAPLARLGARWDPINAVRLAASLTWGGTLEAQPVRGDAEAAEYKLPLRLAGGASAYLAPSLLATVSGRWSGWSRTGDFSVAGFGAQLPSSGRDTWEVGGGLELDDPESRSVRSYPIRVGGSYRQLPFTFGDEAPSEWFVGAGAGMRLGSIGNPAARFDLSVQRGERTAPASATTEALTETAWRVSLALSIFGT